MWILEEGQILPYLRSHYPVFDQSGPVDIQCIGALEGEEKPREPDEGGLINYIFRVSNGKQSVIVKQGAFRQPEERQNSSAHMAESSGI